MRWFLAVVAAVVSGAVGSLVGGLILSLTRNQPAMDTASAFLGTLSAVYVGSQVAPLRGRAAKIFATITIAFAAVALAAIVFNPRIAAQEGAIIGQPAGQIVGAVLAFMLIRAQLGDAPTAFGKGVSGVLGIVGVLLAIGSGLYTAFLTVALYGALWGPLGVLAVFSSSSDVGRCTVRPLVD